VGELQLPDEQSVTRATIAIKRRRWTLLAAGLLCLVVSAVASTVAAGASGSSTGPSAPYTNDPAFAQAWQQSQSDNQPRDAQARQASATAYENQTATQALDTAKREHPDVVLAPAWKALSLGPGEQVTNYLGDHAARVDVAGQASNALVESTMPLRTSAGQPVDLSLSDAGQGFAPENPLVATHIGDQASQPTELGDIGVGASPVGASPSSGGQVVADKVFYANAYADTDLLVRPLPAGAETLFDLRSAASPESYSIDFSLPAGANLAPGSQGEDARIVRGGQVLATIPQAVAWDADHQPVPVTAQISGQRLTLQISHRSGEWAYPILLDPSYLEAANWSNGSAPSYAGWQQQPGPGFFNDLGTYDFGRGLYTFGDASHYYNTWDGADWHYDAPGSSDPASAEAFIFRTDFDAVSFRPGIGNKLPLMRAIEGIWNGGASRWEGSPLVLDSDQSWVSNTQCVASGCGEAGSAGNSAHLTTLSSCSCTPMGTAPETYMGAADVWLGDNIPPRERIVDQTFNGQSQTVPTQWIDDAQLSLTTAGADGGLGVRTFDVSGPGIGGTANGTLINSRTRTLSCAGPPPNECPNDGSWVQDDASGSTGDSFSYNSDAIPSGRQTVSARVLDPAGNSSAVQSWQLKVDHLDPVLTPAGSLYDHRGRTLEPGVYRLAPRVQDPDSGVKTVEVLVDGQRDYLLDKGCSESVQCPNDVTGDYQFATATQLPGPHEITVRATDALGHHTDTSFDVTVDASADCPGAVVDPTATSGATAVRSCNFNPNTFGGTCSLNGHTSYTSQREGDFFPSTIWTQHASGSGTCSGLLNGHQLFDSPVVVSIDDIYECQTLALKLGQDSLSGNGTLTFNQGTPATDDDVSLGIRYQLAGQGKFTATVLGNVLGANGGYALNLAGADEGSAVGALTLSHADWGGCSPEADDFSAQFHTVTGLHDAA
jgi:hypothetical protein